MPRCLCAAEKNQTCFNSVLDGENGFDWQQNETHNTLNKVSLFPWILLKTFRLKQIYSQQNK